LETIWDFFVKGQTSFPRDGFQIRPHLHNLRHAAQHGEDRASFPKHIPSRTEDMPKANGLKFTSQVGEFPSETFSVVGFELTESLSQLFFGRRQLASTDSDIDPGSVLEQSVDLVIWQHNEPLRRVTGVVSEFVIGDNGHHRTRYEIVLQSPLWRLELMYNSRIFQGQTTESIASALLQERGIQLQSGRQ
jgi:uncharacterized protein involved in type VI secretion and phage assembly